MDFGTIALIFFICLEVLAEVFNAIDKRTGFGRKIETGPAADRYKNAFCVRKMPLSAAAAGGIL